MNIRVNPCVSSLDYKDLEIFQDYLWNLEVDTLETRKCCKENGAATGLQT